jgi:diacylglycerol kinase family enzyme
VSARQSLLAVLNPAAGRTGGDALRTALDVLRSGADVETVESGTPEECRAALGGRRDRRPVVLGGDGTLRTVVQLLFDSGWLGDSVLGLVPVGTGNDFARSHGLPLDPVAAARLVLDGVPARLELLVDDRGGIAVNAVHVGVGAEAAARARPWKPLLKTGAFAVGSALAGARARGWRLRVEVDGRVLSDVDQRVLMVGVALGSSIGGGTRLAPGARRDDGLADVVVSAAVGPLARIGYGLRLRGGNHGKHPDVLTTRARTVTVSGQPYSVNADGELTGPVRRRTWTVAPGAWRVTLPR